MSIFVVGENCCEVSPIERAGVLVDGRAYYRSFYETALSAERYILLTGWQFDTSVRLVRGQDAGGEAPAELKALLDWLCERRPELRVYVLAWDYSLVYVFEREWLQRLSFGLDTHERVHFRFDSKHPVAASHHQKLAIVDGAVAYAGGMDLCASRWDDRRHALDNPERNDRRAFGPYHDVMSFVCGEAVRPLERLFVERWRRATDEELQLPGPRLDCPVMAEGALELSATEVAISRTWPDTSLEPGRGPEEIRELYRDAIASAEQLVYVENQYFTSMAIRDALIERMRDRSRPALSIVLVMPKGADSPKEKLALGRTQEHLLATLEDEADENGHELRILYSASSDGEQEIATFIHSKLIVVDDRFLSVGSANLTNRSMGLDSELNLSWETDVAHVRASLLAEHAGVERPDAFVNPDGLVRRIDELCASSSSRLQRRRADRSASEPELAARLAFDAERPIDLASIEQVLAVEEGELERKLFASAVGRLIEKLHG